MVHVAGLEIEAIGCLSRIRHPYKTTGFTPRVPYFAPLPSRLKPPPLIALASYARATTTIKLAAAFFSMLLPPSQWTRGTNPTSPLSA